MWSRGRARRLGADAAVVTFAWEGERERAQPGAALEPEPQPPAEVEADPAVRLATLEREAYERGFAQGEAAGTKAAAERADSMLRQLAATLDELTSFRRSLMRQTERQMVELALAVARRIVMREVGIDRDLLIAMARVALERLGEATSITVRLHPDDYEAIGAGRVAGMIGSNVMVLADPRVGRGGCRVESDLGALDAGIDAQLHELGRALLGDTPLSKTGRNAAAA